MILGHLKGSIHKVIVDEYGRYFEVLLQINNNTITKKET